LGLPSFGDLIAGLYVVRQAYQHLLEQLGHHRPQHQALQQPTRWAVVALMGAEAIKVDMIFLSLGDDGPGCPR
jgi:hypothetical protein